MCSVHYSLLFSLCYVRITDYHDKDLCNVRITRESVNADNGDHSSTESEEERDNIPIDGQPKWDCESILSTYSNLYNHPTLIKEAPRSHLKEKVLEMFCRYLHLISR